MILMQKIPFIVTAPMMNYHSTFISSRSIYTLQKLCACPCANGDISFLIFYFVVYFGRLGCLVDLGNHCTFDHRTN